MPISYGAKAQLTPEANASERLDKHLKRRIQEIVGLLLYYTRAADNKLLVALSAITACQSYDTVATEQAVHLLLNYVATYPADDIIYSASDTILCAHADAGFLNETTPAAEQELISFFWRMIPSHISTGPYSPLPKSSSSLWPQQPNQNLQPCLSQQEK